MIKAEELVKPYQEALSGYLMAGWEGVLPLPPKSKFAPPKGFTGRSGATPTEENFSDWIDRGGNIALRLPENVIGLDIDAYGHKVGQKTFEDMQLKHGKLPETWYSSRHENTDNGRTLLFRVPDELTFISGLKDIDVIQNNHRYLTAPPSFHPSEARYVWYSPSGTPVSKLIVPEIDALEDLPDAWLELLINKETEESATPTVLSEVAAWNSNLDWLPVGVSCSTMSSKLNYYLKGFKNASSRHDYTMTAVMSLIYSASDGHGGIVSALDTLRTKFITETIEDRGMDLAVHEFNSIVSWANTQIKEKKFSYSMKSDPCKNIKRFTGYKKKY